MHAAQRRHKPELPSAACGRTLHLRERVCWHFVCRTYRALLMPYLPCVPPFFQIDQVLFNRAHNLCYPPKSTQFRHRFVLRRSIPTTTRRKRTFLRCKQCETHIEADVTADGGDVGHARDVRERRATLNESSAFRGAIYSQQQGCSLCHPVPIVRFQRSNDRSSSAPTLVRAGKPVSATTVSALHP